MDKEPEAENTENIDIKKYRRRIQISSRFRKQFTNLT